MHAFPSGKKRMIMVTFFSYAKPLSFPSHTSSEAFPYLVSFKRRDTTYLLKEKHGKEKKGYNQVTMRRRLRKKYAKEKIKASHRKGHYK